MYAKIENDVVVSAPTIIKGENYEIINPKDEDYIAHGYVEVVKTAQPIKEGYYYTSSIENINGVPTEVWTEHEIVKDEEDE